MGVGERGQHGTQSRAARRLVEGVTGKGSFRLSRIGAMHRLAPTLTFACTLLGAATAEMLATDDTEELPSETGSQMSGQAADE
ncbi:hypothetical protein GCM10017783_00440 [Deinococcus piscis]|uniref:Uncharacterized protein n=1 Tax=Deinococcus piscis TaxID=394230 RepID=A0ABQ3JWR6_9DEIO|nr:hypothetical protein GCM10017783_00440 [Deinococcus piscis]